MSDIQTSSMLTYCHVSSQCHCQPLPSQNLDLTNNSFWPRLASLSSGPISQNVVLFRRGLCKIRIVFQCSWTCPNTVGRLDIFHRFQRSRTYPAKSERFQRSWTDCTDSSRIVLNWSESSWIVLILNRSESFWIGQSLWTVQNRFESVIFGLNRSE